MIDYLIFNFAGLFQNVYTSKGEEQEYKAAGSVEKMWGKKSFCKPVGASGQMFQGHVENWN